MSRAKCVPGVFHLMLLPLLPWVFLLAALPAAVRSTVVGEFDLSTVTQCLPSPARSNAEDVIWTVLRLYVSRDYEEWKDQPSLGRLVARYRWCGSIDLNTAEWIEARQTLSDLAASFQCVDRTTRQVSKKCIKKLYRLYGKQPRVLDPASAAALQAALCQQRALAADMLHAFREPRDTAAQPYRDAVARLECAVRVLEDYVRDGHRHGHQQRQRQQAGAETSPPPPRWPSSSADDADSRVGGMASYRGARDDGEAEVQKPFSLPSSSSSALLMAPRNSLFEVAVAEVRRRVGAEQAAQLPQPLLHAIRGLLGDGSGGSGSGSGRRGFFGRPRVGAR